MIRCDQIFHTWSELDRYVGKSAKVQTKARMGRNPAGGEAIKIGLQEGRPRQAGSRQAGGEDHRPHGGGQDCGGQDHGGQEDDRSQSAGNRGPGPRKPSRPGAPRPGAPPSAERDKRRRRRPASDGTTAAQKITMWCGPMSNRGVAMQHLL